MTRLYGGKAAPRCLSLPRLVRRPCRLGVFYGDRLGYALTWWTAFPFSLLSHPQYVGALLTIWGFFLAWCFPRADWYVLPVLETVYYALGSWVEERG